ncbi:MAG: helix-turn-helix transcriptional regulator [Nocardioidaceae bacterium]|jgi:ArsR family transcriptional regulator|nr:helix-turn-helix transcriptional regulator [Nocardioidaceae bacterium]
MSTTTTSPPGIDSTAACHSCVTGDVLDIPQAEALAQVFKALSDPTRVRLVSLIAAHAGAEACVCELTEPVGLSQPTVSHHLKQLVEAGLLSREQRGRWAYYRVVEQALDQLAAAVTRRPDGGSHR